MSLRRTPLKRKSDKARKSDKLKKEETVKMQKWFREIWDSQEDEQGYCYCYETGVEMHGSQFRSNSTCYHHILPKSKYPQFRMVEKNIVILHPDVHAQVESNIDKCPKTKELTNRIKEELLYDS